MIIPVRCYSCNRPIGSEYEEFKRRVADGEDAKKVLDDLGVTRYCCRRMILSQVDLIDEIAQFEV